MIVKIPSLNESVKDIPDMDNKEVTAIKEIKNIILLLMVDIDRALLIKIQK